MTMKYLICAVAFFGATSAQAVDNKISVTTERTDYSKSFGKRQDTTLESRTDWAELPS